MKTPAWVLSAALMGGLAPKYADNLKYNRPFTPNKKPSQRQCIKKAHAMKAERKKVAKQKAARKHKDRRR